MGWRFCGWTTVKPAAGPLGCPPGPAGKRKKLFEVERRARTGGPDRSAELHRGRRTSPRSSQRLRAAIARDGRRDVLNLSLEYGFTRDGGPAYAHQTPSPSEVTVQGPYGARGRDLA